MSEERLLAKLFTTTGLITLIDIHKEELEEEEEHGGADTEWYRLQKMVGNTKTHDSQVESFPLCLLSTK